MSGAFTIGIIGTGHLAAFLVEGCRRQGKDWRFLLSPRGEKVAADLAERFGCQVASDNQAVVEGADLVLLSVLPRDLEAVAGALTFRQGQEVLCAAAAIKPGRVAALAAPALASSTMMPGHANALGVGPSLLYPDRALAHRFLEAVGPVIALPDEESFLIASVFGGFSGMSFAFMRQAISWFQRQGLPLEIAKQLVVATLKGNASVLLESGEALEEVFAGIATPGGITEQGVANLKQEGALEAWDRALDGILQRMRK